MRESKWLRPFLVVWTGFQWILVLGLILAAVLLVGVRFFGYTPYTVLTSSMAPQFKPGTLIYVKKLPMEEIHPGTVITFVANDELQLVTHRVVAADYEKKEFLTQGDANETIDSAPVLYENILGTVQFSIPKVGYLSAFLNSKSGQYTGIAILLFYILSLILQEFPKTEKQNI